MSATTKHKLEFAVAMARHTRATVRQIEALMRYAGTLQRIAESECNDDLSDELANKRDQKKDKIRHRVTALLLDIEGTGSKEHLFCRPSFSGDPRGCVLKIRVPDGFSDDGNGEGMCVPS